MSVAVGIATLVLVCITAFYAYETRRLVGETRRMADQMRNARSDEAARARFERSREHAIAVREAVREIDLMRHKGEVTESAARRIYEALDRHGPLIGHEAVRERIRIAALVAFTASWQDDQFENPAMSRIQVRLVGEQARWAVECYLREEPLPPWPAEFPMRQWAQPWTIQGGKFEHNPNDDAAKSARAAFDALGE